MRSKPDNVPGEMSLTIMVLFAVPVLFHTDVNLNRRGSGRRVGLGQLDDVL